MARLPRFCAAVLLCASLAGAAEPPTEYDVKAVFLYNFGRFGEWPAEQEASGPFRIGVLGSDPFGSSFEEVSGRSVRSRPLEVVRGVTAAAADSCQILFVPEEETPRAKQILARVGDRPVLTVGEGEQFVRDGGAISFVLRGRKVRFLVNPDVAERAGIRLSSRLLRVAEIYRTETAP